MASDPGMLRQREPVTIAAWTAAGVGLGTAVFLALVMTGTWFYFRANAEIAQTPRPARFAEPQVQSNPAGDLRTFQARQREQLEARGLTSLLTDVDCLVVVAGLDAALASVVSGLTEVPVVAVPTSAGTAESTRPSTATSVATPARSPQSRT